MPWWQSDDNATMDSNSMTEETDRRERFRIKRNIINVITHTVG